MDDNVASLLTQRLLKYPVVICFLYCFICSCQHNGHKQPDNRSKKVTQSESLEMMLTDSLRKYMHLNEFVSRGDSSRYVLYGEDMDAGKIGIVVITDSVLLLSQVVGPDLRLTNRITFADYASDFKADDLNGDYKDDFIVYGHANMHGQKRPYVFMSDSEGILHYLPAASLYNIEYDWAKKELHSFYFGGVNSMHSKGIYRWQGDSVEQVAGLEYDMGSGEIELYRMRKGKRYQRKFYHNHNEVVFDTALFKVENY
jgi:hypothetical protein